MCGQKTYMNKKELIQQGVAEAEKEAQEKEIAHIKEITKRYLSDIQEYKTKEESIKEKRKILEAELTDLKNGRLDKIKERQEADERCREVSPIIIVAINNNYPLKPWLNEYYINWRLPETTAYPVGGYTTTCSSNAVLTGSACQIIATGAYNIGGEIINL